MAEAEETSDELQRAAAFWDVHHADADSHNFLNHPLVQAYVSLRAFGSLVGHLEVVVAELRRRTSPGDRVLSIGCGAAGKERVLARMLPDRRFVGIDIAAKTLQRVRDECAAVGLTNLEVEEGDFNRLELEPGSFQSILGLGAIHHVEKLEAFWEACARGLRPGGAVLAQEYVGPERLQWTDEQRQAGDRALAEIVPIQHQPHHRTIEPTPIDAMLQLDPSEAVRSTEILSTCKAAGFAIDGYAGAGCALLQPVLMNQITTYDPRNWQHNLVLARLFAEEERLMQEGVLGDDFASFVAVPPAAS